LYQPKLHCRLKILYGRKLTLPLKEIYHNVDVESEKYVQS
jgi:hypothetical protein